MKISFVERVAQCSKRPVEDVQAILNQYNIVDSPTPPASRPLRVKWISFSGEKNIKGEVIPFNFEWEPKASGINVVASDSNLVGKSSIFQVMLWALRGEPKSLTTTVQSWIRRVEVDFLAGDRHVRVQFDVVDGVPNGAVELLLGDGKVIHSLPFSSSAVFKAHMNGVMLDALALEPIATAREVSSQEKTVMYSDGWASYTGAFLFDSDSTALIGEATGTDLAQRLLQVFLGIPWATTLFQSRAAMRVTDSLVKARKRKLGQLGNQSVQQMKDRLAQIAKQIADGTARDKALEQLALTRSRYEKLASEVSRLQAATTVIDAEAAAGAEELLEKKRTLLAIEEELAASRFLGKLSPTCCPRCTQTFESNRLKNESATGECSVCLTQVEEAPSIDHEALKATTAKDITKLQKALVGVTTKALELKLEFENTRKQLEQSAEELAKLSASGTAQEEQKLRIESARLEGMLEAVQKLVQTDTGEEAELEVLTAATDCAKASVEEGAEEVLDRSGKLIRDLVTRLGMRDVEEVKLKRSAAVDVHKGGSVSSFTGLSAGERLRVRIATVIALLQASVQFGAGRHPGLLVIDSPGKEEVADANVEEMLDALSELATSVNIQLFVAFRGTARAKSHFSEEFCRLAEGDATLW